jgi:hypothetical protein
MQKGYLTAIQHARILEIQQKNMDLVDPLVKKRKESVLFGKLAIKLGLVTPEEVNECLRLQAERARPGRWARS